MNWYNKIFGNKKNRRTADLRTRGFDASKSHDILANWRTDDYQSYNGLLWEAIDTIRARARDADNNSPLATGFIKQTARGVVGSGFALRPNTGNKDLDEAVLRLFDKQSKSKNWTTQGNTSRTQFEYLVMYQLIRDGEVFIQKVRNYKKSETGYSLRLWDAAQVFTQYVGGGNATRTGITPGTEPLANSTINKDTGNRVVLGIEVDEDYRPVAYHLRHGNHRNDISSTFTYHASDIQRVPADDVIHLFVANYPNQTRGLTWLHSALYQLEQLKRFQDAALLAARQGASKAFTIISNDGSQWSGDDEDNNELTLDLTGETLSQLPKGTMLQAVDPKYPHEMFRDFVNKTQEMLANALDTNASIMFGNFGDINYSAGQIALLDMREKYKALQKFISEQLYGNLYCDFINHAILHGHLEDSSGSPMLPSPALVDICTDNYEFKGKQFSPVDLAKSALANKTAIESKTKSRAQVIREMGMDPDEIFAELEAEEKRFGVPEKMNENEKAKMDEYADEEEDKKPDNKDDDKSEQKDE